MPLYVIYAIHIHKDQHNVGSKASVREFTAASLQLQSVESKADTDVIHLERSLVLMSYV